MLYKLLHIIGDFVLRFFFLLRVRGSQHYKGIKSGFILISNHTSNWDPVILGDAIRGRHIVYMAKEELFSNKIADFFLRQLHAIPLTRGAGDVAAVKTALRVLREGSILGIFPEGTRARDGKIKAFEPGAALLALRAGVPVLPAYIQGGYRFLRRVTVWFGEPIDLRREFPGKVKGAVIKDATRLLRTTLLRMEQEALS